jgi:hypothetical protein
MEFTCFSAVMIERLKMYSKQAEVSSAGLIIKESKMYGLYGQ